MIVPCKVGYSRITYGLDPIVGQKSISMVRAMLNCQRFQMKVNDAITVLQKSIRGGWAKLMELTREETLKLHRQMWSDMKELLGDCPPIKQRIRFKETWCINHTPEHIPENDCYLCEYASQIDDSCKSCPIDWGGSDCLNDKINYRYSPISKILELPEREVK